MSFNLVLEQCNTNLICLVRALHALNRQNKKYMVIAKHTIHKMVIINNRKYFDRTFQTKWLLLIKNIWSSQSPPFFFSLSNPSLCYPFFINQGLPWMFSSMVSPFSPFIFSFQFIFMFCSINQSLFMRFSQTMLWGFQFLF